MYEIKGSKVSIFIIFILFVLLVSCSRTVTNKQSLNVAIEDIENSVYVLPLENHTETPLAGRRVASILEGVLRSKGFKVENGMLGLESRDYNSKEISELMKKIKKNGIKYAFSGSVNEYRYKTGIDGEPAVSITINLYKLDKGRIIWSSTGAKTGWSYESLGTITQKLLKNLIIAKKAK